MTKKIKQVDFMHECAVRGLYQNDLINMRKYLALKAGDKGEKLMYEWLLKLLPPHAIILKDVWFKANGTTQVDLLVFLGKVMWVIEVKNYNGIFRYENHSSYLNDQVLSNDQIAHMRNRMVILQEILRRTKINCQLKGTMVFIHENSEIQIDSTEYFDVITKNQVNRIIKQFIEENSGQSTNNIIPLFEPYKTVSTFELKPLTENEQSRVKKGAYCSLCQHFEFERTKKLIVCKKCGHKELKKEAIFRQYCCYGLINFENDFITTKEIYHFSEGLFSRSHISVVLKDEVEHKINAKKLKFKNYCLPVNKLHEKFPSIKC